MGGAWIKAGPALRCRLRHVRLLASACAFFGAAVAAQTSAPVVLPPVRISAQETADSVEKSYRSMVRGMELFDRQRALAPEAQLRFKLLPRHRDTDLNDVQIDVVGTTAEFRVPLAAGQTFVLPRDQRALDENAEVMLNRRALSMTWRTDIRTPGLAADTRRLGDLRLECRVGMEAGLVSNTRNVVVRIARVFMDTPAYCERKEPRYLFFADRPLFSVALVSGARKEFLPADKLYASATTDPDLKDDLAYCDCEVLLDRSYELPLGDTSWPDDTLVEFEYMDAAP